MSAASRARRRSSRAARDQIDDLGRAEDHDDAEHDDRRPAQIEQAEHPQDADDYDRQHGQQRLIEQRVRQVGGTPVVKAEAP